MDKLVTVYSVSSDVRVVPYYSREIEHYYKAPFVYEGVFFDSGFDGKVSVERTPIREFYKCTSKTNIGNFEEERVIDTSYIALCPKLEDYLDVLVKKEVDDVKSEHVKCVTALKSELDKCRYELEESVKHNYSLREKLYLAHQGIVSSKVKYFTFGAVVGAVVISIFGVNL